ncbi:hypothetical protein [Variovorax sp. dw_308]|uniref:hypothetical protein n=1 Tax=Variovorax sp. dw_308 TaxID=2721546 RepID=UPI001C44E792|nr:hypothetical protein [Variovorax sp. dw_308]
MKIAGLERASLRNGCRIYRFKRLPLSEEVEYELTAKYPDGLVFNPVMHSDKYPPGSNAVHQWRLVAEVPVEHLLDLAPAAKYPYLHA